MDWMRRIDGYCERLGPDFWAEPLNAASNAAFLLAAAITWARLGRREPPLGRALAVILAAIGIGSFLWHSFAQVWAALADIGPIAAFVLLYFYAFNRHVLGFGRWPALALVVLFVPAAAAVATLAGRMPGLGGSAAYAPGPLAMALYAALLRRRAPAAARGLALGTALLLLSLGFRSLDAPLCGVWPAGTHFVWQLLNAALLGWMIEIYRRATVPSRTSSA